MKLKRRTQFHPAFFHLLPVVNVLFLVFMLFSMSSRFVLQQGVAVALPISAFALAPQPNPQIVTITAAPVPAIYHIDRRVTFEELDQRLGSGAAKQRSLIIKADRNTPFDLVNRIANSGLKHGYSVMWATMPERR